MSQRHKRSMRRAHHPSGQFVHTEQEHIDLDPGIDLWGMAQGLILQGFAGRMGPGGGRKSRCQNDTLNDGAGILWQLPRVQGFRIDDLLLITVRTFCPHGIGALSLGDQVQERIDQGQGIRSEGGGRLCSYVAPSSGALAAINNIRAALSSRACRIGARSNLA